jgi:hypothetical protein
MPFARALLAVCALTLVFPPRAGAAVVSVKKCMTILKPGTYVLTADLITLGTCFLVQSDNVLITLQGFKITGSAAGAAVSDGGVAHANVSVVDGFITGFTNGIELFHSSGRIDRVGVSNNTGVGARLGAGTVSGIQSFNNGGDGIGVGDFVQVINNTVHDNDNNGITGANQATITANRVNANGNHGIVCGNGCLVNANNVEGNDGDGIHVGNEVSSTALTSILSNKVQGNGGNGIVAGSGAGIQGNDVCVGGGNGIVVGSSASTIGNVVCDVGGIGIIANQSFVGSNTVRNTAGAGISLTCPAKAYLNVLEGTGGFSSSGLSCEGSGNVPAFPGP